MRSAKELFGTGGLETEGPLLLPNGSTTAAALGFSSKPADGFRWAAGSVMLRVAGSDVATWTPTGVTQGFGDGTAAAPSISFLNDTDTGFYRPGADIIGMVTGGVERLRVDAAGSLIGNRVGGGASAAIQVDSVSPGYGLRDSDEAVDGRYWDLISDTGLLHIRAVNDANTVANSALKVSRSGVSIVSTSFGGSVLPLADNAQTLGSASFRWTELRAIRTRIGPSTTVQAANVTLSVVSQSNADFNLLLEQDNGLDGYALQCTSTTGDLIFLRRDTNGTVNTERMRFVTDGRIFGKVLHNNAGAITGTTNQYIASGTYTPALTNVANVTGSSAASCQFIRVGNVCTVSGKIDIDPTTTLTVASVGVSLPIASNFTAVENVGGTFATRDVTEHGVIAADVTNDRFDFNFLPTDTTNRVYHFTATYVIL